MKKSLCITICMCLLCLLFFNICYADVPAAFSDAVPLKSGDLDLKQLSRAALSSADVPEVIPHSLIAEKQHVNRLYAQEEGLDTVIFQNRDGSKTAYIYDAPVKYLAEDGSVRDKSNTLTSISGEYRYMNMENDVAVAYPEYLAAERGVLLFGGDFIFSFSPDIDRQLSYSAERAYYTVEGERREGVLYDGVFGANTALRYTCTFNGFKEDIILNAPDANVFRFIVQTDGYAMVNAGNSCKIIDPQTEETVAGFGSLYVYDSSEQRNTVEGAISCEQLAENESYLITMSVPQEFFTPDTVYPVYVDPSVSVSLPGYQNISAATISETKNYTIEPSYYVGNQTLQYPNNTSAWQFGNTKTLLGVKSAAVEALGISGSQILSAQILLYDVGQETSELDINVYNMLEGWIPSLAGSEKFKDNLWNAREQDYPIATVRVGNGGGVLSDGTGSGHWYAFEATRTVRNSADRTGTFGIMLEAQDTSVPGKTFADCYSNNPPVVVIDYTELPINGVCMLKNVGYNSTVSDYKWKDMDDTIIELSYLTGPYGGRALWDFQPVGNNFYTIRNYSKNLYLSLENSYPGIDEPLAVLRDRNPEDNSQLWTLRKTENGNYVLINKQNADQNQYSKVLAIRSYHIAPIFGETFVISDYRAGGANDEFIIQLPKKTFYVDLYTDNAFLNRELPLRIDEATGKAEEKLEGIDRLYRIIDIVENFYKTRFDVDIKFSNAQIGTTCADLCESPIDQYCHKKNEDGTITNCKGEVVTCTNDLSTEYHHKNLSKMLLSINVKTDNYLLFYTGHFACCQAGAYHTVNAEGYAFPNRAIVTEGGVAYGTGSWREKASATTHEIGHFFGGLDHYSYEDRRGDERDVCIFGCERKKPDVIANLKLCRDCRESIARGILISGFVD